MTPLWIGVALAAAFLVVAAILRGRRKSALLTRVRREWGQIRERERDMEAIARAASTPGMLDDRTWADLNLDDVFSVIDRNTSAVGQVALYRRLRTAVPAPDGGRFDGMIDLFSRETGPRESIQAALARLDDPGAYGLTELAQPDALTIEPWHAVFPVLAAFNLAAAVATPVFPPALFLLGAGVILSLVLRGMAGPHLRGLAGAFRSIGPLVAVADAIAAVNAIELRPSADRLRAETPKLARLRRLSDWVSRDAAPASSGELGGVLIEYLNVMLCLDANALFFGSRDLRRHGATLQAVFDGVGEVDAALAVASYRAGTPGWVAPRIGEPGSPLRVVDVRHPLLPDAVPNSVDFVPPYGVIVTGSNMSGKTTFLRTIGVTVVLAQSIHTCVAGSYAGPPLVVRTCIGRADDPASGKSYYLVEVQAVLEMVHAAQSGVAHLMLFDELFRGTNAVERISAGEAVLAALLEPLEQGQRVPHIVIAATHDLELVEFLAGAYASAHFADSMDENGLSFDYRLRSGAATTRNAIAVLRWRGAPDSLVARALARADALDGMRLAR